MRRFSELYEELDASKATLLKVAAMRRYFREAAAADAAWAAYILSGRRLKRFIGPARLAAWLVEAAELPPWLIEESRAAVGDLAETIALLMDTRRTESCGVLEEATSLGDSLAAWIESALLPLRGE